jgi:hypothetical protein
MVSPSGGNTLNLKIFNAEVDSNLPIFLPKPWKLDLGFHVKTSLILSIFYKKISILIPILLVCFHMGENFKTNF